MLETLGIIFGSLLWLASSSLLLTVILFGVLFAAVVYEYGNGAFISLLGVAVVVLGYQFFFSENQSFLNFFKNHWNDVIALYFSSIVIGMLWTIPRWGIYLNRAETQSNIKGSFESFKREFYEYFKSDHKTSFGEDKVKKLKKLYSKSDSSEFDYENQEHWKTAFKNSNDHKRYRAFSNKGRIFNWATWWFIDILYVLFRDVSILIKDYIFEKMNVVYTKIESKAVDRAL